MAKRKDEDTSAASADAGAEVEDPKAKLAEMEREDAAAAERATSPNRNASAVRRVDASFRAALPAGVGIHYDPREGDGFFARYDIDNGAYRVLGSDWIFTFRAGRLVSVDKAVPPAFGGPDVIAA